MNADHDAPLPFTPEEMLILQVLHTRYQDDRDCFSDRERERLRFMRWLYEVERLHSERETEDFPGRSTSADSKDTPGKSDHREIEPGRTSP